MKIEYTKEEIWASWDNLVNFMACNPDYMGYPDGSVMLIKKVLESFLEGKNG